MAQASAHCPYCNSTLPTHLAKQCFKCGMDWHDPSNVVRRGAPDWNRFGLRKTARYVVELCQKPTGERYTKYRDVSSDQHDPFCVLETEPAFGSQFIEWGFYRYADHLRLANGTRFGFEAHGIWLSQEESDYLRHRRGSWEHAPWVNGIAPLIPPS